MLITAQYTERKGFLIHHRSFSFTRHSSSFNSTIIIPVSKPMVRLRSIQRRSFQGERSCLASFGLNGILLLTSLLVIRYSLFVLRCVRFDYAQRPLASQ